MFLPYIPEVVYQDAAVLLQSPSNKKQVLADQYEYTKLSAVFLSLRPYSPHGSVLGGAWLEPRCCRG